jgi:signal transduction histidine kinase
VSGDFGPAVQISVEDDGPGIDPLHEKQIFEPFFTTKKDVGTGLGLWVSKQIVQRHGGSIHASSRIGGGRGARFVVVLPAHAADETQAAVTA